MDQKRLPTWALLGIGAVAGMLTAGFISISRDASASNTDIYRQLDLFGDVLERVRSDYVEKPNDGKLIESAISGMLTSLDPHSSYMNPKSFEDMRVQTRGEFGGLGIEVTMEKGVVKVVSPIDDTPASKAGVLSGDLITHLDGDPISGLTLGQAVEKMRGRIGSPVMLTVIRKGHDDPLEIKVVRDVIRIKSVRSRKEKDVGYVRITSFNEQTYPGLRKAIAKLKKEIGPDIKGYILDLRNNPGGLLDQAIAVSDAFLEKGAIVMTRGRNEQETNRANAKKGDLTDHKKVVVLMNGGSASASEIVAGALQDHKRALVIGTRSFGKGSVQTIIPLGSNGALRLTTARYYTPSGKSIQAKGITPDRKVIQPLPETLKKRKIAIRGEANLRGHLKTEEGKEGESGSSAYVPADRSKDVQLKYAVKLLRGEPVEDLTKAKDVPVAKAPEASKDMPRKVDTPAAASDTKTKEEEPATAQ